MRSLRELVAAWGIAKRIACRSKWGVDLNNRYSQGVYAGYFFTSGLDAARAIHKIAREAFDNEPRLGPSIGISIRRGCAEYEAALGPPDRFTFAPELAELEDHLRTRFRSAEASGLRPVPMAHWIETACRIGDETYLDFTGGKRLHRGLTSRSPASGSRPRARP